MSDLEQRTPEWYEARRGKLTASNVGAALGQVSYTSRAEAYRRALGTDTFTGNDATRWGVLHEADGVLAYTKMTGADVTATGLHTHETFPWLAGSPDGLVGEEGLIEVKCPYYYRRDGSGRAHRTVPPHYFMQCNALLAITGRNWCDYMSWTPEGVKCHRIMADPGLFEYLLQFYGLFFAALNARAAKPPTMTVDEKKQIKERVLKSMEVSVVLDFFTSVPEEESDPFAECGFEEDGEEASTSGEDAPLAARAKRQRVSEHPGSA